MDHVEQDNTPPTPAPDAVDPKALDIERRLQRNGIFLIVVGVIAAFIWADLKMALGVALGGALSLFNAHWLSLSTKAILEYASATGNPTAPRAAKFLLRFLVILAILLVAAWSGYFNFLGVGIGLVAFVGAAMIEAVYQLITFKE